MFKKLFNLAPNTVTVAPVLVKTQPTPFKKKVATPSIKVDAMKTLEKVLTDLQDVNNPKVDALRKLFLSIENGSDMGSVVAFCKEPITAKKKPAKKKLISGKFY